MNKRDAIVVGLLFYLGWFSCIFVAKTAYQWASLLFPAVLIAFLVFRKHLSFRVLMIAAVLSTSGILFDSILARQDYIEVLGQTGVVIPLWLVSIWLLFSYSMMKLGRVLRIPIWLGAILGFVLGPLSYKSGEFFQVLRFLTPQASLVYAVFWALAFSLVLFLSRRVA